MVVVLKANAATGAGSSGLPSASPTQGQVASVAQNAITTVVSRIVPTGFTMRLVGIIATGSADAEWIVLDNATEVYRSRTSNGDRSVEVLHGNSIPFASGHTCTLKVVHQEISTQNFYGTLLSYDG